MMYVVSNKIVNSITKSVKSVSVDSISFNNAPTSINTSGCISMQLLHNRLSHPNKHAMQIILKTQPSHVVNTHSLSFCDACQYGKLHQFHFPVTEIKTRAPLELIHADLWGLASMPSKDGYKYYISFVDNFTRYCWIFPLTLKSEALDTFKHYKLLVEKQFSLSIKTIQSDMESEFRAFRSFLQQQGIHIRFSCPHTHHQNRVVERKHRHIIETDLTLLAEVNLPLTFWWEAFHTTSYLINKIHTPILNNKTPYKKLHNQLPDY